MAPSRPWTLLALLPALGAGPALAGETGTCIAWQPQASLQTSHFTLHYDRSGVNAPAQDDVGKAIARSDGVVIGYAGAANGVPDYVEEAAIGLEYARETYRVAGLRVPESQGVYIKDDLGAYGLYLPECHDIYLEPDLVGVTRTAAHELGHAVQYEYWGLDDFAAIPGSEQAFYKEATADAMMIQAMRPAPYVSWFDTPDAKYLLNAGTGAAFFWLYFGERYGAVVPDQDVLPGLAGMARYLELVADPTLDLRGALETLPTLYGETLDEVMEDRVLADLLEDLLSPFDPAEDPGIADYGYVFAHVRGFYNAVAPVALASTSFAMAGPGRGHLRSITLDGVVSYRWNADYFEIDPSLFAGGGRLHAALSTGGAPGVGVVVAASVTDDAVQVLTTRRLEDGWVTWFPIPDDPHLRLFLVTQSLVPSGALSYRFDVTLVR